MNDVLKEYIKGIEEEIQRYKSGELRTKEYLQLLEELNEWLKEQKQ